MRPLRILSFLATLVTCFTASASGIPPADFPDLVEKTLPGVVNISSLTVVKYMTFGMEDFFGFWGIPKERHQTQTSLGTGFIIDETGFVLTNNHVVDRATSVLITLYDKRQFEAKIIGKDQKMDVALLQLKDKEHKVPANLKPIPLGNSDNVRIAESVFAVGNPFGLQHTVTTGIISAKNRTIGQGPFDNFLQTDASINPGNSGGPLFNGQGEVIGINTMIFSRTGQSGGLGFAIPINEAKRLIPDFKQFGRIPRPWLGILGEPMSPQKAAYFGLAVGKGVLVYKLVQDAPADRAGFRQGDIIVAIEKAPITETFEVERALAKFKPRDKITVTLIRAKKKIDIILNLGELPKLDDVPQGII